MIVLWLLDNLVESNRGYKESIIPCKNRKRKESGYYNEGEEDALVKVTNLQKIYNNKIFALTGVTAELKRG